MDSLLWHICLAETDPLERPKLGSSGKHTVTHFELNLLCFLWFYLLNLKPILQGIILDKNKPPKCSQNPWIVQFTFHIEWTREQSISYIKNLNKNPFEQRNGYLTWLNIFKESNRHTCIHLYKFNLPWC